MIPLRWNPSNAHHCNTFTRRYVGLLILLGLARGVLLLLAYPPAQTADSNLFFLYADRLAGYDAPILDHFTYPLYPFLILLAERGLGSIYWLIGLQIVMGAAIAPLYFYALRPYSRGLAVVVSLLLLGDVQTGVWFHNHAGEPLYMFLLALSFCLLLRGMRARRSNPARDALPGALLVLLWLTRTMGRYLIVPYALVFWLYTRDVRRTLALVGGFGGALLLYVVLSTAALGRVAGLTATDYSFSLVMRNHPTWVQPGNGPATRVWLAATADCDPPTQFRLVYCLYEATGSWVATQTTIQNTVTETVMPHLGAYVVESGRNMLSMLGAPAAVNHGGEVPGHSQCETVDWRAETVTAAFIRSGVSRMTAPLLGVDDATLSVRLPAYRVLLRDNMSALCPPLPNSSTLRHMVDTLMRWENILWPSPLVYGVLLALVVGLAGARPLLPVVLIALAALLLHTLPPALLAVHTDHRYIVVTNAPRLVLLGVLLVIVVRLAGTVRARRERRAL